MIKNSTFFDSCKKQEVYHDKRRKNRRKIAVKQTKGKQGCESKQKVQGYGFPNAVF